MEVVANYPLDPPPPPLQDHPRGEGATTHRTSEGHNNINIHHSGRTRDSIIIPTSPDRLNGRPNRSSSSPSSLEEEDLALEGEEEVLAGEEEQLEERDRINASPRKNSTESGHSDVVDFTRDQRHLINDENHCLRRGSDSGEKGSARSSQQGSTDNGSRRASDAKSLGSPIMEELIKSSACGQISKNDLHNHNHNNNIMMRQEKGQEEEEKGQEEAEQEEAENSLNQEHSNNGGSGTDVEDLASQLIQLQTMVKEMREGFTGAMEALTKVQYGDRILEQKVDSNKAGHEQQLADVVQMVLALKCEFGGIVSQLAAATDNQQQLRAQVDHLQYERDILLEELEQHSVISENVRQKYHSGRRRPNGLTRANDSSLSVLLERARSMFTNNGNSDQDSGVNTYHQGDNSTCGEVTPPNVSPMVHSYIAGLHNQTTQDDVGMEENYESDSSLTQAANKSLDMSRSLGDKCAELTNMDSSDEEEEEEEEGSSGRKKRQQDKNRASDVASPHFTRPSSPKRTPPHEKNAKDLARSRVAYEVLETERKYCSCLWTILDHFANPLKDAAILPLKETNVLFPECLSRIYEHHCAFLQRLEERVANWKCYSVIGDVFSTFIDNSDYDVLVQYRAYVTEFPSALNQLKKSCRHSLRFRKFLRKCQTDAICEGLDLSAFLLTPVQRIPRYVLLLKQLMKYTVPEHIDYYYVEACLAKLGTFLAQLNDSIEYSMKIVAEDVTPKSKRKIRVGSLRSSSSSFDGIQLSSATRDSGIQSSCDNNSMLSNSSNNGRLFQVAMLKDSDRPLGVPADRPLGVPDPNLPHSASFDSRTMPSMGTRRQRERLRRPKSSDTHLRSSSNNKNHSFDEPGHHKADEHVFLMPRQVPPRPSSVAGEGSIFGDSFKGQLPSGYVPPWKSGSYNAKRQDYTGQYRAQSPPVAVSSHADLRLNTSATSMRSLPVTNSRQIVVRTNHSTPQIGNSSLHKSLMNIPGHDYGIYGNDPSDEGPSTTHGVNEANSKRRAMKLSLRSRSQGQLAHHSHPASEEAYSPRPTSPASVSSTGNIIIVPGASSLSQHQVNMALAKSIADDVPRRQQQQMLNNHHHPQSAAFSQSLPISDITSQTPGQGAAPRKLERPQSCLIPGNSAVSSTSQSSTDPTSISPADMRPRSSSTGHNPTVVPVNTDIPNRPCEHVWDDSITDNSTLNASDLTGARKNKKKKKERQKKVDESLTSEGGRRKGGFKDSLKNIFFKKRKGGKEKSMLQDVLAEDSQVKMTSLKIPLKSQDSMLNISPNHNRKDAVVSDESVAIPKIEITGSENTPLQGRLKKRPHSVCYGSIMRSPQEKKSNLKTSSSLRSSLRWSLARPVTASTLAAAQGSKVVEIGGGVEYKDQCDVENQQQVSPPLVAAPKDSLIITSRTDAPDFSTYEDENGDPCSAV